MLSRFTSPETNFRLFLLEKKTADLTLKDEPHLRVPVWREPQPFPHRHQDLGVLLVIKGAIKIRWWDSTGEERILTLAAGQTGAVAGTILHTVEVDKQAVVRGLWLHPTLFQATGQMAMASALSVESSSPTPHGTGDALIYSALLEIWGQAQAELGHNAEHRSEVLNGLAQLASWHCLRLLKARVPTSTTASTQRVQEVRAWLDRHYLEASTLEEMAAKAGLATSRFSQLFKAETGFSPNAYRQERRLFHAADLLSTTDWPVSLIGEAAGFSQQTAFYRAFQTKFGHSPGEHRKKVEKLRKIEH